MQKRFFEAVVLGLVLVLSACGNERDFERGERFSRGDRFSRDDDDSDSDRRDEDSDEEEDGVIAPTPPDGDDGSSDNGDGAMPGGDDTDGEDGSADGPQPYPGAPGDGDDGDDDQDGQEPLPTPAPAEDCDGIPAQGLCEFDIMITCENNRRVEQQCDTICGQVDGQLACLSDTAMIIEFEAPTFVCQGQAGPFVMVMAGGEVISYDQAEVEVAGTYEYVSSGMRFDIPGRMVGDTTADLVEAMMILGFEIDDGQWCNAYGYDPVESFDASYDCGAVDSLGGYGIASKAFTLSKPGHVVLHSTIDSQYGTSTKVYEGVYRVQGDRVIMATIQGDMTIPYSGTLQQGGLMLDSYGGTWCGVQ